MATSAHFGGSRMESANLGEFTVRDRASSAVFRANFARLRHNAHTHAKNLRGIQRVGHSQHGSHARS